MPLNLTAARSGVMRVTEKKPSTFLLSIFAIKK